jgi:RNA polymerase sigma-70 factor, ECF subfamily
VKQRDVNDRKLLTRAGAGDAAAFERLYRTHFPIICSYLRSRGARQETEDVAQEAFRRAWEQRAKFGGRASAKTYLIAIARNVLREARRRRSPAPLDAAVSSPERSPVEPLLTGERERRVLAAVGQLPPKQQEAVRLTFLMGFERSRAAGLARCSTAILRWRLADAYKRLRRLLSDQDGQ